MTLRITSGGRIETAPRTELQFAESQPMNQAVSQRCIVEQKVLRADGKYKLLIRAVDDADARQPGDRGLASTSQRDVSINTLCVDAAIAEQFAQGEFVRMTLSPG